MNPFQNPSFNEKINSEVKWAIQESFNRHNKIEFFDMIKYLETSIENKDFDRSHIAAYYVCNVILSRTEMSNGEKKSLIDGICMSVSVLESGGGQGVQRVREVTEVIDDLDDLDDDLDDSFDD